jgi:dTDP-4-dehydrorhamnose reductase
VTRVAVIGSAGQLGTDLVRALEEAGRYDVIPLTHAQVECARPESVRAALATLGADVVVNCAGYVRVDECEDRPDEAFQINASGALHVARVCEETGALCVYTSTDYVFGGDKGEPYTEDDPPCPINVYGVSKVAGEYLVRHTSLRWVIVRVASLFGTAGARGKGGNFIEAILGQARRGETLRVVGDIRMSPVYAPDAAWTLERLIHDGATGLFHIANRGSCTWYEFARRALELTGTDARIEAISASEYPSRARRPANSSLSSLALPAGSPAPSRSWEDSLRAYLAARRYASA